MRILRGSPHFQSNTWQHWTWWVGLNVTLGALAFILASAIPVFNYLLALAGSVCFAPMALVIPPLTWFYDSAARTKRSGVAGRMLWGLNALVVLVGVFLTIGGV